MEQQNSVSLTELAVRRYCLANQLGDYLPHGHPALFRELPGNSEQVIVDFQSGSHICTVAHPKVYL